MWYNLLAVDDEIVIHHVTISNQLQVAK